MRFRWKRIAFGSGQRKLGMASQETVSLFHVISCRKGRRDSTRTEESLANPSLSETRLAQVIRVKWKYQQVELKTRQGRAQERERGKEGEETKTEERSDYN